MGQHLETPCFDGYQFGYRHLGYQPTNGRFRGNQLGNHALETNGGTAVFMVTALVTQLGNKVLCCYSKCYIMVLQHLSLSTGALTKLSTSAVNQPANSRFVLLLPAAPAAVGHQRQRLPVESHPSGWLFRLRSGILQALPNTRFSGYLSFMPVCAKSQTVVFLAGMARLSQQPATVGYTTW